jgi:predicted signal transduction protein with EAL and GGDEF domain
LTGALRGSDLAVRFGGDEFAVLLIDGDADYTMTVAERLTACIAEPFLLGSVEATIGASIGVASAPADATDSERLLVCADVAMYRAKLSDTPFATYKHDLDRRGNRFSLAEELRAAIEENELVLHYQPQLDLRSGEIAGVEALVRWDHPKLGLLPPLTFLPLAEEAGLMRTLTAFVVDEALAQCAGWRAAGTSIAVSVNVASSNLLDPGFTALIEELLELHNLPANALVLEITETSIITEFDRSRLVIEQLRDLGLVVSIDDFGAGFTSLAYLNKLAVGELKLDRAFIAGLTANANKRDTELVRATIHLGHALGLRVVAEGIEDSPTLDLLTGLGCDLAQGYFIGEPKPAGELSLETPRPSYRRRLALARSGL